MTSPRDSSPFLQPRSVPGSVPAITLSDMGSEPRTKTPTASMKDGKEGMSALDRLRGLPGFSKDKKKDESPKGMQERLMNLYVELWV
jgi:hypothetical protein